jgi:hypothetical protein
MHLLHSSDKQKIAQMFQNVSFRQLIKIAEMDIRIGTASQLPNSMHSKLPSIGMCAKRINNLFLNPIRMD